MKGLKLFLTAGVFTVLGLTGVNALEVTTETELNNCISAGGECVLKNNITASLFKFSTKEKSFKNAVTLLIKWKEKIPFKNVEYLLKKNKFYFTEEEKDFYGEKIIQDIIVFR